MKKLFVILSLLKLTEVQAQFYAGDGGFTIKSGTEVSFDNLSLRPSSNLTIANNALQRSGTAIPGNPNGSISRVYRLGSAIEFSGTVTISYLPGELNGNLESDLQISFSPDESLGFTITTGSVVDQSLHRVSNVFSNAGLVTLSASGTSNALPVTLIDFKVYREGQTALLEWSTSSEMNADRFVIERSANAKNWMEVGQQSAAGESSAIQRYVYKDADALTGLNYYRLKMIDRASDTPERDGKDGRFAYSQIRSLMFNQADDPVVFPNPVTEKLFLKNITGNSPATISMYETSGVLLFETTVNPSEGLSIKKLPAGSYILKISQSGKEITRPFVKQ